MKRIAIPAALALLCLLAGDPLGAQEEASRTFALEMQGKVVGLFTLTEEPMPGGLVRREHRTVAKLSLLGRPFDLEVRETTVAEAATGRIRSVTRVQRTGESEVVQTAEVKGDKILFGDGSEAPAGSPVDLLDGRMLLRATARGPARLGTVSVQISRVVEVTVRREGERDGLVSVAAEGEDLSLRLTLLVERETGRIAGLRDRLQGVVVRPAPAAVLGAAARADLAEALSLRVDLPVDFRALTYLEVRAVIDAPGEVVTPESLNVPGQEFEGTVAKGTIRGVFRIRPRRPEGPGKPLEPAAEVPADLERYLAATEEVDAEDEAVRGKTREILAAEGAVSRRRGATALSSWVSGNVRYGLPGRKASAVLASGSGDCGGQARLLTALCRAAGLPARVVSGGAFTPYLGGSFSQHAWVEVWLGKEEGWLPLDPTAGENEGIDAGHLRLGERVGFLPREIEVLDYAPRQDPGRPRPLPFETGKVHRYDYFRGGRPIGSNTFVFREGEEGRIRLSVSTRIGAVRGSSLLVTDAEAHPLSYRLETTVPAGQGTLEVTFSDGRARVKAEPVGMPPRELSREVGEGFFLFDNNSLPHWALFLPRLGLAPGRSVTVRLFHPGLARILALTFRAGDRREIDWGGGKVEAMPVTTSISGKTLTLWLDGDHRLLRDEEGPLRVDLAR